MSSTIEKISEHALQEVEQELNRLLGLETTLTLRSGVLARYEDFIEQLDDGSVVVRLEVDGVVEGNGALAVTKRNAIRLAGKLLMLPVSELNQSIAEEAYDDEYQYAYSEIVKCFVRMFVQALPKSTFQCAEIRCKKQEFINRKETKAPLINLQSDQPYYLATIVLSLAGVPQEDLLLLLPAIMVVCGCDETEIETTESTPADMAMERESDKIYSTRNPLAEVGIAADTLQFENMLYSWISEVNQIFGSTFGVQVVLVGKPRQKVDEKQIRSLSIGKKLLFTFYRIDGPVNGEIVVNGFIEDAIRIGSILGEIPDAVADSDGGEGLFTADRQDGFLELNSILLARWVEILTDLVSDSFAINRKSSSLIECEEEDPASDQILEERQYVMFSLQIKNDGKHLGYMNYLYPAFFVEQLELIVQDFLPPVGDDRLAEIAEFSAADIHGTEIENHENSVGSSKILLINASEYISKYLCSVLKEEGLAYEQISSTSQTLQDMLMKKFQSVFLVVGILDEMALSNIIKISSLCSSPLVVAAPQWTQSQVIKALRYGAADIVVTPVDGRELRDKVEKLGSSG